jgi:hypothetical protein
MKWALDSLPIKPSLANEAIKMKNWKTKVKFSAQDY